MLLADEVIDGVAGLDFVGASVVDLSLLVEASAPTFARSPPTDTRLFRLPDDELRSLSWSECLPPFPKRAMTPV